MYIKDGGRRGDNSEHHRPGFAGEPLQPLESDDAGPAEELRQILLYC